MNDKNIFKELLETLDKEIINDLLDEYDYKSLDESNIILNSYIDSYLLNNNDYLIEDLTVNTSNLLNSFNELTLIKRKKKRK
ncbi:hypothetical protein A0H76_27 [Hepatospora eriocheir]|uniref:Uncharacterized protein n=1 Tax=Hepatospora eriocheir TaxID=1081669 RepID=A0A1X0QER6_9MICR|nr:hypothetical protein HERIO_845 [Hepatospora eriocheir]ORD98260.1 hypothetical protein A0H76_27 [Hepatospora eriocheir]